MNLVEATLESRDGRIEAVFGGQRLELAEDHRSSVEEYVGRNLVVGIRPEDMEDASFAGGTPAEQRIEAAVELVEQMGSEAYVHFEVDAPPVLTEDTRELARDVGLPDAQGGDGQYGGDERSTFVARVSPRTKAAKGDKMQLVVDTARLHFFVPESGLAVGPEAPATTTGATRSA
jgi:multiple sugar transport system ATP-binding protein